METTETKKREDHNHHHVLDCRVNSVAALLRHHGVEIDPLKLLFIGDGYGIAYDEISMTVDDEYIENLPIITIGGEGIEEKILNALGVQYKVEHILPTEEGHQRILTLLKEGKQILARTDLRAGAENADPEESFPIRPVGTCLITDYDAEKDEYVLFWSNTNIEGHSDYVRIKRPELEHYRGTACLPLSPDYFCLYIESAEDAKKLTEADINALFKESLIRAARSSMNSDEFNPGLKKAYTVIKQTAGLQAIHDLRVRTKKILKDCFLKGKKNEDFEIFAIFFFALLKNNLHNGSFSAYRMEFVEAVELCRLQGGQPDDGKTKQIGKFVRVWFQLIASCMKLQNGVLNNKKEALYVLKLLREIERTEKQMYPLALRLLDF